MFSGIVTSNLVFIPKFRYILVSGHGNAASRHLLIEVQPDTPIIQTVRETTRSLGIPTASENPMQKSPAHWQGFFKKLLLDDKFLRLSALGPDKIDPRRQMRQIRPRYMTQ